MPDDPFITQMDPVQKMWMFYSWLEDKNENNESYKNHAYLIGGFSNPAMLQKIIDSDNNRVAVSDQDFEESMRIVKESANDMENTASLKRRRRRKKIGN
jgi:hypothetical protein